MLSSLDGRLPCSATRPSLERATFVPIADCRRGHTSNQASRAGNDLLNGSPKTRQNFRPSRCGRPTQLIARGDSGASCDTITRTDSTWASTAPPVDDARTLGPLEMIRAGRQTGAAVEGGAVQLPEVSLIGLPCTALALAAATVPRCRRLLTALLRRRGPGRRRRRARLNWVYKV